MNQQEFRNWIKEYGLAFPTIADWLETRDDPAETLKRWEMALASTDAEDAGEVLRRMIVGDIDAPLRFEARDQTAIIVKREAAKLRGDRRRRTAKTYDRPMPSRHGGTFTPLRVLIERAERIGKQLKTGNLSQDAHDLQLESICHEARKGGSESRRYRCGDCHDSGLIICWHVRSVAVFRAKGELLPGSMHAMSLACGGCEAGRVFWIPESEGGRRNPMPRYDSRKHCRLISGGNLPAPSDVVELQRWLADDYLPPYLDGEFAQWNETGVA